MYYFVINKEIYIHTWTCFFLCFLFGQFPLASVPQCLDVGDTVSLYKKCKPSLLFALPSLFVIVWVL